MKIYKISFLALLIFYSFSCQSKNKAQNKVISEIQASTQDLQKYETAYFASGCFWCVEAIYESVKGVKEAVSGYSGGTEKNPTYEEVGRGLTSHTEAVKVYYDPKVISFKKLVTVYYGSHNPTTVDGQAPDFGKQYRSVAFYKNDIEKKIIEDYIAQIEKEKKYDTPIATQVVKFDVFYDAEDYHQDFKKKHPTHSYIKNVSFPRLNRFKKKFPELLKNDAH